MHRDPNSSMGVGEGVGLRGTARGMKKGGSDRR